MTRTLGTPLVAADAVIRAIAESPEVHGAELLTRLSDGGEQTVRGRCQAVRIWIWEVQSR